MGHMENFKALNSHVILLCTVIFVSPHLAAKSREALASNPRNVQRLSVQRLSVQPAHTAVGGQVVSSSTAPAAVVAPPPTSIPAPGSATASAPASVVAPGAPQPSSGQSTSTVVAPPVSPVGVIGGGSARPAVMPGRKGYVAAPAGPAPAPPYSAPSYGGGNGYSPGGGGGSGGGGAGGGAPGGGGSPGQLTPQQQAEVDKLKKENEEFKKAEEKRKKDEEEKEKKRIAEQKEKQEEEKERRQRRAEAAERAEQEKERAQKSNVAKIEKNATCEGGRQPDDWQRPSVSKKLRVRPSGIAGASRYRTDSFALDAEKGSHRLFALAQGKIRKIESQVKGDLTTCRIEVQHDSCPNSSGAVSSTPKCTSIVEWKQKKTDANGDPQSCPVAEKNQEVNPCTPLVRVGQGQQAHSASISIIKKASNGAEENLTQSFVQDNYPNDFSAQPRGASARQ